MWCFGHRFVLLSHLGFLVSRPPSLGEWASLKSGRKLVLRSPVDSEEMMLEVEFRVFFRRSLLFTLDLPFEVFLLIC